MIIKAKCTIDNIIEKSNRNNLYCFGAGAMGKDFADFCFDFNLDISRFIFVDNNKNKHNTFITSDDYNILVISKDEMLKRIKKGDIIIIATLACKEIYEDLEKENALKEIEVGFSQLLLLNATKISTDFKLKSSEENLIPKIIHYCWFGKGKIPAEFQKNIDNWKIKCPDYEIIEWNESNYDITKNKYMQQAYENKRWGFVPDYARLDIIYNYGGIYLDTDVELLKNLDCILSEKAFFSINSSLKPNLGNGFGSMPKHPLIKKMRDYYDKVDFIDKNGVVNATPCMEYQYRVLKKEGFKITGKNAEFIDFNILPFDVMCGYNHYLDNFIINENTISAHKSKRTWHDDIFRKRAEESVEFLRKLI